MTLYITIYHSSLDYNYQPSLQHQPQHISQHNSQQQQPQQHGPSQYQQQPQQLQPQYLGPCQYQQQQQLLSASQTQGQHQSAPFQHDPPNIYIMPIMLFITFIILITKTSSTTYVSIWAVSHSTLGACCCWAQSGGEGLISCWQLRLSNAGQRRSVALACANY